MDLPVKGKAREKTETHLENTKERLREIMTAFSEAREKKEFISQSFKKSPERTAIAEKTPEKKQAEKNSSKPKSRKARNVPNDARQSGA